MLICLTTTYLERLLTLLEHLPSTLPIHLELDISPSLRFNNHRLVKAQPPFTAKSAATAVANLHYFDTLVWLRMQTVDIMNPANSNDAFEIKITEGTSW